MSRSRVSLVILVVLIAAILAAPAAWGAPRQASRDRLAMDFMARVWHSLATVWLEAGCVIDPHGGCATGVATPPGGDNGCGIDPHGTCQAGSTAPPEPQPTGDIGCGIDPHGGCTPGS